MDKLIDIITRVNKEVNTIVWGAPMLILILGIGLYFTLATRFFQLFKIKEICKKTIVAIFKNKSVTKSKDKKAISQFQAISTALAATIGTGSIAGVATAITIGGAGAVFWMWVSSILGMMTVYAENVLGIFFRKKNKKKEWQGGAMYYIEHGLNSKWLAVIFAIFCIFASFGMGNMAQANSISAAMQTTFSIDPKMTGIVVSTIVGLVIIGGIKRIGKVTERLIPIVSIAYILGCLAIMLANFQQLPWVFESIFKQAFGIGPVAGGISGAMLKNAITIGVKRGVFSNEAGLGSSVMVNAAADVKEPVVQGMWGIFEVFIDTMVVCTLSAVVVLSSGVIGTFTNTGEEADGSSLIIIAFQKVFGGFAGQFVSISILIFALATIIGWSYFGEKAIEYLLGAKSTFLYKALYIAFVFIGANLELKLVWDISDTLNGLMAIPNITALILLSGTVIKITNNYLRRNKKKNSSKEKPMLSAFEDIQAEQEKLPDD